MAFSQRGTSPIIKSSCGIYSSAHNKNARSRTTFLLLFMNFFLKFYALIPGMVWRCPALSEFHILVRPALSRTFSQECSELLLQQQRLSTMIWMKKKVTLHSHSQPYDFHPEFILRNAIISSNPPVVGERCFTYKNIRATALFDKYFHSFSSKQLSSSDQCVKNEAYINGNENSSINSRWSISIQ